MLPQRTGIARGIRGLPSAPVLAGLSGQKALNGLKGLEDYAPELARQTIFNPATEEGPTDTPIIPHPGKVDQTTNEILKDILGAIKGLPDQIARSFRHYYTDAGRDAQYFFQQSQGVITIPNTGVLTAVTSYTVQDNFEGALLGVGVNVLGGNFPNVQWYIRINGVTIMPGFNGVYFDASNLSNPLQFRMELIQDRKVELMASQTAVPGGVVVEGLLFGYTAYMADWKVWGRAPEAGVG